MKRTISHIMLACLLVFVSGQGFSQLQDPTPPVNIIIDSDMAISADDVGDHAMLWGLANRGEIKVLAEICSSANDFSAPVMHIIATYYGHPEVPIGAHKGSTPNLENSASSSYAQAIVNFFGPAGDTRANYPDPVPVYRQALAGAADHSVFIVSNGYSQPLQALLQSPADSISPLTGMQLVALKVRRLISGAGFFPSGNEHNLRVDADAAKFVFENWPGEIVSVGVQVSQDVITGPSLNGDNTKDPVKRAYDIFNGSDRIPGFGQVALLYAVRGLGANFVASGVNGHTLIEGFSEPQPGQDNWFQTPNTGHAYLNKAGTAADLEAIINPLVASSTNLPMIRSISPSSLPAGSSAQAITLNGLNFFTDSQATFNGSSRPTTFVSGSQITVQLTGADLAQAGTAALTVTNAAEDGWQSSPANFTITGSAPSPPVLSSISPNSAVAGSGAVSITATGANFSSNSVVQVNGSPRSTAFVSGAQMTATLTATDTALPASLSITVTTPGVGTSAPVTFTVTSPAPVLSSISPSVATAGGPAFTLTANGSNFVNGAVVQVNGSNRSTTFVSGNQLTASILSSDISSAGTRSVTVVNPDGSATSAVTLTVNPANNPVPVLTGITPGNVLAGSGGFTLTANGSNFVSGAVVKVNGSNRTTTFISGTQLSAAIPAGDVTAAGNLSITVFNPGPGGGISAGVTLTVTNPAPALSSLSPASVIAGSGGFMLTVNGSNFVSGAVVQVNGGNRSTTFASGTQISASIPATDIAAAGSLSITVVNPGGARSGSLTLLVNNPVPAISSISPATTLVLGSSFTLTVNGTGFNSSSVVQVNGSARPTTFVSATQLQAQVSNSDILTVGQRTITVLNPAPGGGVSNGATLTVVGLLGGLL